MMIGALLATIAFPALADMTCRPESVCTAGDTCEAGTDELLFVLRKVGDIYQFIEPSEDARSNPGGKDPLMISGDGGEVQQELTRLIDVADGPLVLSDTLERGETTVLSLHGNGQFTLSIQGSIFGEAFGMVVAGKCLGEL